MAKPYSQDLRERVLAAVDGGMAPSATARVFRVDVSYIYKVLGRRRATGETSARPARGGQPPKLAAHYDALRERVAAVPDATLAELQAWLRSDLRVSISIGALWGTLKRLGLSLKKSRRAPPSRIGRMSPRRARPGASSRRR